MTEMQDEYMTFRALTHEPIGKPGGPGVWGMKGKQYPAYFLAAPSTSATI
jgi:hypothetical protein